MPQLTRRAPTNAPCPTNFQISIRRIAQIKDWIIGTGSKIAKDAKGNKTDLSHHLIYAMQVTDKKSLLEYDAYCQKRLRKKIPDLKSKDPAMNRRPHKTIKIPTFQNQ